MVRRGILLYIHVYASRKLPTFKNIIADELPPTGFGSELDHCNLRLLENGDITLEFCFAEGKNVLYSHDRRMFFEIEGPKATDLILKSVWGQSMGTEEAEECFDPTLIPQILSADTTELRNRTVAHIEDQIAACQIIGDTTRLVPWICAYAQRLALDENYEKAMELIASLQLEQYDRDGRNALQHTLASYFATSPSSMIRRLADDLCSEP